MPITNPSEEDKDKARRATRNWMKYSGMAMQMIGVLLVFVLGGRYLDEWLGISPWLTVVFSLSGVAAALYLSLKDFL